ncbi:acyl carrier protein [Kitasatospora sp. NPDC001664]|uniref:acyl carrier protein n=1 Tax=Kitasatospora albolonga TaxID=68173 RepID=UPI0035EECC25
MHTEADTFSTVRDLVAAIAQLPPAEVEPGHRLVEDLDLDSLQITALAQKLQNALGRPVDEDLLIAPGTTVANCAALTSGP